MRTLDEVIKAVEEDLECANVTYPELFYDYDNHKDALHYLKEYKEQKYIWKKLYLLAHQIFWGLEEEYPLDGERIANDLFDAYSEGFDDEND